MTSERIKQVILQSQFYKDFKQEVQTIKGAVLQLEFKGDEEMINTILTEINTKLDALQSDVSVLIVDKNLLQDTVNSLKDRITAIEPQPEI